VAVVLVFIDHTIMIEHRTDAQLCAKSDLDEALDLLENIMKNIRKFKDDTILFFSTNTSFDSKIFNIQSVLLFYLMRLL